MTKKQRSKYIKQLIEKWRPLLFLNEWNIFHEFVDDEGSVQGGRNSAAEISVNFTYKSAHIKTFSGFWRETPDVQDDMICHELCHCHTQELWDFCVDFANGKHHTPDEVWRSVETLTQRISVISKYSGK